MDKLSTDVDVWQSVRVFLDGLNELTGKSTIEVQLENAKLRVQFDPRSYDALHSRFRRLTNVNDGAQARSINEDREHKAKQKHVDDAWGDIVRYAINIDAVLGLFAALPDKATAMAYTGLINGERTLDALSQSKRYSEMAAHAKALLDFLALEKNYEPLKLRRLFSDLDQDQGRAGRVPANRDAKLMFKHTDEALEYWLAWGRQPTGVNEVLSFLYHAFSGANPHRWYAKQPNAKDAAKQVYTFEVARLNIYLSSPRHSALATIANANCKDVKISANAIQKKWLEIKTTQPNSEEVSIT